MCEHHDIYLETKKTMNNRLLKTLKQNYPNVLIVMASKYLQTFTDFKAFLDAGVVDFGENRDDALKSKQVILQDYPIHWHFIGTLQTKKVKHIIDHIDVLHSLDRIKLAQEINRRRSRPLDCYLQVNISSEDQKHGFAPQQLGEAIEAVKPLQNIRLIGLMGMAEETDDESRIRTQFNLLKQLRDYYQKELPDLTGLSMGMSQDYHIALEVGATVLRLGRILLDGGTVWEDKNPHITV